MAKTPTTIGELLIWMVMQHPILSFLMFLLLCDAIGSIGRRK